LVSRRTFGATGCRIADPEGIAFPEGFGISTSTVMALAPVTPVIRTVAQIRLIRRLVLKGTARALVSTF